MKNILIRADSSSKIGIGHIMRDLVLVKEFDNSNIIFACQDLEGNINSKIKESGYELKILKSNSFEELDVLLKSLKIDFLIIDHYKIDYDFEKQLKIQNSKLKILSFDDTYEKHYCDILLNHNIYAKKNKYLNLVPEECDIRCGGKYTLIRDEFLYELNKKYKINTPIILLALGGTDHSNVNLEILKVLEKFDNIFIRIVTTSSNKNLDDLDNYVKKFDNITLYIDSSEIAKLIKSSTFSIVSPSVIVNEILYLNTKFIAIKSAENQKFMYLYLKENNYNVLENFDRVELELLIANFLKESKNGKYNCSNY